MTLLQDTQQYGSDVSITFNEERQLYIGRVTTRQGERVFEGADYRGVSTAIQRVIDEEYYMLLREVDEEKARTPSRGGGRGGGRGEGLEVPDFSFLSSLVSFVGRGMDTIFDILLGFSKHAAKYAVVFGGIKIMARSRGELKKKLTLARNKRLHIIMHHMREHKLQQDRLALAAQRYKGLGDRVRKKKEELLKKGPSSWERKIADEDPHIDRRVKNLRRRIKASKDRARDLWVER